MGRGDADAAEQQRIDEHLASCPDCRHANATLRDVMTITEWVNESHMSVRHQGLVTGEGTFRLTENGNDTTVTWTERLRFPLWLGGPLGELVARPIFLLIWRGNLRRLAQIVEN